MFCKSPGFKTLINSIYRGIFLLFLGCGSATPVPAPTSTPTPDAEPEMPPEGTAGEQPSQPFDLEAMLKREFEPLPPLDIKNPSGNWTARAETTGQPAVSIDDEGTANVTIPVGTAEPVTCLIYKELADIGGTMNNMFGMVAKTVTYQKLEPSDVGVVANHAMLAARGLYTVKQNGEKAVGLLKLVMYDHPRRTIACYHDELGYYRSFLRVTKGLFGSFVEKIGSKPEPREREVWTAHLSGIPIGFSENATFENRDGTWISNKRTTLVVPRTANTLYVNDEFTGTKSDNKGRIRKQKTINSEGGELSMNIDVERVNETKYSYKGEFKGKQVEGFFKTKRTGLLDDRSVTKRVKKILGKSKDEAFSMESYHPQIDPTKTIEVKYEVFGSKTPKTVTSQIGQMLLTGIADKNGDMEQMTIPFGARKLVMKRAYSHGKDSESK